jgi:spermidine synthase
LLTAFLVDGQDRRKRAMTWEGWFTETLHADIAEAMRIDRMLYESQPGEGIQGIKIFENRHFGRVLTLDGVVQTTERDECIYHEMLTNVPILGHGHVSRVLIIGGGDGGMLRHSLMHPGVEQVTMVEIDQAVVDMCKTHLPMLSQGAFEDLRTDLVIGDGRQFVAEAAKRPDRRFDVIIVDSTDPIGPGEVLFTADFYADCRKCLTPGGILVTQGGVPDVQPEEFQKGKRDLDQAGFASAGFYVATVPSYYGGPMAFGFATDDQNLWLVDHDTIAKRDTAAGRETRYYTPAVHKAAFALPRHLLRLLEAA